MINQIRKLFDNKKYNAVIVEGKKLIQQDQKNNEVFSLLAQSYIKIKDYDNAMKYAEKLIDLDKNQAIGYSIIAAFYIKKKDFNQAQEYLDKSLKINPILKEALYNYSLVYYNQGLLDKAEVKTKELLSHYPDFGLAYLEMGFILQCKKQFKEARGFYKKARSLDSNINISRYLIGTYLHLARRI